MWYLVLSLLSIAFFAQYFIIPKIVHGIIGPYVITPIIYIFVIIFILILAKKRGLNIFKFNKIRKLEFGRNPFEAALLIAALQIALMIIAGIFFGMGKSPFSHIPFYLVINAFFIFPPIIAIEFTRSFLVKNGMKTKYSMTLIFGILAIVFIWFKIPPNEYLTLSIQNPATIAQFIGETIVPNIAMSLFAAYLVYIGGAYASIGYFGTLQVFHWYSPILPDFDWGITALIGTFVPTIGYIIIQNSTGNSKKTNRKKTLYNKDPTMSWIGVALICTLIIFFSTGFFGVQPSVIYSGSMRNTLDVGDLVIVTETTQDQIKVGDIIQFRTETVEIPIIHRIIEIEDDNGFITYITKGDANKIPDKDAVQFKQIQGKVVFNVPKIGWLSIYTKDILKQFSIG